MRIFVAPLRAHRTSSVESLNPKMRKHPSKNKRHNKETAAPRVLDADLAFDELTHADMDRVAQRDNERLEVERHGKAPHIAAKMTAPTHSIRSMMREWEILVTAMDHGWQTIDYIVIDDYVYALDMRALLGEALNHLQPNPPQPLTECLNTLDRRFLDQAVQEEPGGAGPLEPWLTPMSDRAPEWLWNRRPRIPFW